MTPACCEERVTDTVRPKCEEVDCGDVELAGGIVAETEVGDNSEDEGRRAPRKVAEPRMPTHAEIQEHNITHLPYRSWCIHCVRGRGEQAGHRRQEARPENAFPEVHMDYCFMGRKSDDAQPILVARDHCELLGAEQRQRDQETLAVLPGVGLPREQGRDPVLSGVTHAGCVGEAREGAGRGEDHNGALACEIVRVEWNRRARHEGGDVPGAYHEISSRPECEHRPWGRMEHTDLDDRVCERAQEPVPRGKDGKTAYERFEGKASKMLGIGFAETVMFRRVPLPAKLAKLESLWEKGIIAGYRSQSGEHMIIGKNVVYKTGTIRRVPVKERWGRAAIEDVKFTPWMIKERSAKEEHDGPREEEHKTSVDIKINKEIELEVKLPPRSVDPNPRRVYITKAVIEKFGGTAGCLGCTTAMIAGKGVARSEQCRERMEEHIRRDPMEKERWMVYSDQKIQEFVNKYGLKRKDEEPMREVA